MRLDCNEFFLRLVEEDDAGFIISLRNDEQLGKHLSFTNPDVALQKEWIRNYKKREAEKTEFYFIAISNSGEPLGLSRVYNFLEESFELGSWIFKRGLPESIPVMADIALRNFGFEQLGFAICRFEVRKANKSVVRYHKLFHPELTGEDELNYYFSLPYEKYKEVRPKFIKLFSDGHK